MIISLQVISGQNQAMGESATKSFDCNGGSFGRATHNAWVLPDPSKIISGQHGMVYFENENFYLTDISTNGIYVNGSENPLGKGNVIALRDGDLITFGDYEIRVIAPNQAQNETVQSQATLAQEAEIGEEESPLNVIAAAQPESGLGNFSGNIDSPNFDPLEIAASSGSVQPVSAASQLGDDRPVVPDLSSEHSSPVNDPFITPKVNVDEALAQAPSSNDNSSVIPEDWDLTGFSNKSQQPNPDSQSGQQIPNYIPDDDLEFGSPTPATDSSIETQQSVAHQEPAFKKSDTVALKSAAFSSPADDQLYQAFIQGMGFDPLAANSSLSELQMMQSSGKLFREIIQGLMILLRARSELKSQFRMSATTIRPTENNPLKFSPNIDEALKALFSGEKTGYLKPEQALDEGVRDIRNHQIAMIAGMQSAFSALLQRLNPSQFSSEDKENSVKAALLSGSKKSKAWEQYCQYYEDTVVRSGNAFQLLFGEEFNRAYEEQLRLLDSGHEK